MPHSCDGNNFHVSFYKVLQIFEVAERLAASQGELYSKGIASQVDGKLAGRIC
jgi:hypothetical protein